MRTDYQKVMDDELEKIHASGKVPKLFLHACCAPCSSYCLEYLTEHFEVTLFYYNPNISPASEYDYRLNELKRLVEEQPHKYSEGLYLRVEDTAGGTGVLLFETDGKGDDAKVTEWRSGVPPQVDYVEGCS